MVGKHIWLKFLLGCLLLLGTGTIAQGARITKVSDEVMEHMKDRIPSRECRIVATYLAASTPFPIQAKDEMDTFGVSPADFECAKALDYWNYEILPVVALNVKNRPEYIKQLLIRALRHAGPSLGRITDWITKIPSSELLVTVTVKDEQLEDNSLDSLPPLDAGKEDGYKKLEDTDTPERILQEDSGNGNKVRSTSNEEEEEEKEKNVEDLDDPLTLSRSLQKPSETQDLKSNQVDDPAASVELEPKVESLNDKPSEEAVAADAAETSRADEEAVETSGNKEVQVAGNLEDATAAALSQSEELKAVEELGVAIESSPLTNVEPTGAEEPELSPVAAQVEPRRAQFEDETKPETEELDKDKEPEVLIKKAEDVFPDDVPKEDSPTEEHVEDKKPETADITADVPKDASPTKELHEEEDKRPEVLVKKTEDVFHDAPKKEHDEEDKKPEVLVRKTADVSPQVLKKDPSKTELHEDKKPEVLVKKTADVSPDVAKKLSEYEGRRNSRKKVTKPKEPETVPKVQPTQKPTEALDYFEDPSKSQSLSVKKKHGNKTRLSNAQIGDLEKEKILQYISFGLLFFLIAGLCIYSTLICSKYFSRHGRGRRCRRGYNNGRNVRRRAQDPEFISMQELPDRYCISADGEIMDSLNENAGAGPAGSDENANRLFKNLLPKNAGAGPSRRAPLPPTEAATASPVVGDGDT